MGLQTLTALFLLDQSFPFSSNDLVGSVKVSCNILNVLLVGLMGNLGSKVKESPQSLMLCNLEEIV